MGFRFGAFGARCSLSLLLFACASTESPPLTGERNVVRGISIQSKTPPDFRSWTHSGDLHARAERGTLNGYASTTCASHVGCVIDAPALASCTAPGEIPSSYRLLHGTLEDFRAYRMTLVTEGVLRCWNSYRGAMGLLADGKRYALYGDLLCQGDRSNVCCPYTPGTKVAVVGSVADDARAVIKDFWICAERGHEPPGAAQPARAAEPLILGVEEEPPTYASYFHSGPPDDGPGVPLAFWFGNRVALWDPSQRGVKTIGSASGPRLSCAVLGPGGSRAFTIDVDGTGVLWDTATARAVTTVQGLAVPSFPGRLEPDASCANFLTQQISWSNDGRVLLIVSSSGRALLFDEASDRQRELEPKDAGPGWFSHDGQTVFLPLHDQKGVDVWDTRTGQAIAKGTRYIYGQFPDGRIVVCPPRIEGPKPCREWDFRTTAASRDLPGGDGCAIEPSASGRFVGVESKCEPEESESIAVLRDSDLHRVAFIPHGGVLTWAAHADVLGIESERGVEIWNGAGPARLAAKHPKKFERGLLFSPNAEAVATPFRIVPVKPGPEIDFGNESPYYSGVWSFDSKMLAVWSLGEEGAYYENKTSLRLRVFDADSGCLLFEVNERTDHPSPRQAEIGAVPPRWIPGTDALELPVFGADSFARLVRPRTGETLWITMSNLSGEFEPVALAGDGHYESKSSSVGDILARAGAPKIDTPLVAASGLLAEFFRRAPPPVQGNCRGHVKGR